MKKSLLFIVSIAMILSACKNGPEETPASMEVTPESLMFAAQGDAPKTITVNATGVEWDFTIPDQDKEWLSAEKSNEGLSVSVTDNPTVDTRNSQIKIAATNNTAIAAKTVLISQSGITYTFEVDKTELTFSGEDDTPQEITVTAEGDGLTWTCSVDPVGKEWAKAEVQDNKIVVTVTDNPKYETRSAKLTIKPSIEALDNIVVTITQTKSTIDPYLRTDKSELTFKGNDKEPQTITVESFGVGWTTAVKGDDEEGVDWFDLNINTTEGILTVTVKRNLTTAPRKGYIIITPSSSEVETVTVTINQEAGDPTLSNLTEDMVFPEAMLNGYARLTIQKDQPDYQDYTEIRIRINDENLTMDQFGKWHGTGGRIEMSIYCERLEGDEYNYMPSVTYNVDNYQEFGDEGILYHYPTVYSGSLSEFSQLQIGTWYNYYENDVATISAPITKGSMTVSREGDVYTIEFNFEDDAQNKITGTFEREFSEVQIIDNL